MAQDDADHAVILSACRTPIGSFGGVFQDVGAVDLASAAIAEAITRAGIDPAALDDVIMGCVLQGGAGMNVARQAALRAGVPVEVPAETVNRVADRGCKPWSMRPTAFAPAQWTWPWLGVPSR